MVENNTRPLCGECIHSKGNESTKAVDSGLDFVLSLKYIAKEYEAEDPDLVFKRTYEKTMERVNRVGVACGDRHCIDGLTFEAYAFSVCKYLDLFISRSITNPLSST